MMHNQRPIGVFDSGVGGLTVVKAIQELLPFEEVIYVGDTQHMPYGDKSEQHIQAYCKRIVEYLISREVKLIVIACNTASAMAASYLRSLFWQQVEIMGVIRPVVKMIMDKKYKHVGIIGTQGTIQSQIYPKLLAEYHYDIPIAQLATPLLAPMIESGNLNDEISETIIKSYLSHPSFEFCDAIVLACTHYPLIKDKVNQYFHCRKAIVDNATPMALEVKRYLMDKKILAVDGEPIHQFYVTEFTENFERVASLFYGHPISIEELDIHGQEG